MKYYEDTKRQLGTPIFSREYLCKPITDAMSIFPYDYLNRAFVQTQDIKLAQRIEEFPIKFKKVVTGCDFAISGSIGADYTVYITMGIDDLERYWLINIWRKQGASHNEQIGALQMIKANLKPDLFVMESNNFQKVMVDLAKEHGIHNVEPYYTTGWNKKDQYNGLPSLSAMFERGQIKFPRGDEYSRAMTDIICSEFNSVTYNQDNSKLEAVGEHDDCALATFFCVSGFRTTADALNINFL
jgi:phage terminase large subunit-like protein